MQHRDDLRVIILAGPNGAGKTTFAQEFLPNEASCPTFINADLIAAGLSPFDPASAAIQAGRLMLQEIDNRFLKRESFAIETTLSGKAYTRYIHKWQDAGYEVKLLFLRLDSADDAVSRVASRVAQGGHHIPENTIRRRFEKGLWNLKNIYVPIVDTWAIYDNTGDIPVLLDWKEKS